MRRHVCLALMLVASPLAAQDCPTVAAFRAYRPPEATRVYAMDGSKLADLSPERRVVVPLGSVPRIVSHGFVVVEDKRFYQHDGVDLRGVGRAVIRNLRALALEEGFSTITMQLARNVFPEELPRQDKLRRKVCEVQLAGAIEDAFTKAQILERYVNQVYMGEGLYGVEMAARSYFGKAVKDVTIAEAALLVGLVKNPEGYNPRRNPARAIQRRNVVLDVMAREKLITTATANNSKRQALKLVPPIEAAGAAPYVVAAIRRELRDRFGDSAAIRGLRVYTGIDPVMQKAAAESLREQIARVERGALGTYRNPKPTGELTPAQGAGSPYLQGLVVALDNRNGEIRALVGGRDFTHSAYDRALQARRQPGSAFKAIVYAAALREGIPVSERFDATAVELDNAGSPTWRPDDLVPDSVTSVSLRDGIALSSNNATVRVGQRVGPERIADMARTLGITTPVPPYPSIVLGSAEVNPAEFAAAFATLANGGNAVKPTLITRIEDAHGKVLWRAPSGAQQVVDAGVAYIAVSMLEDVVDRGTATAVRRAGFLHPAAGKTGTTNEAKDVWFVGMTPDLSAAVWLGFDQPRAIMPNAYGGNLAAPVWAEVMKAAYITRPAPLPWTAPAELVQVPIDINTGHVATPQCPPEHVRVEYYLPGTEPTAYCPVHRKRLW